MSHFTIIPFDRWIHDYQDACVEKLERFIRGEVSSKLNGQDLPTTIPHGNRHARNNDGASLSPSSSMQRTLSNESARESDGSGTKE